MPIDLTPINEAIARASAEATRTQGTEESAGVIIASFGAQMKAAVTAALEADAAANATTVKAATDAIDAVTAQFAAADDKLGAAIAANPGTPAPEPTPAPPPAA